jgi:hypothetical protein
MTDTPAQWRAAIQQQFDPPAAAELIENINGLLEYDADDVLRQFASEFVLDLRALRHFIQQVQYETSPETKALPLLQTRPDGQGQIITVEAFCQMILERIAETRQNHDLFSFYVMALSEQKGSHDRKGNG